MCFFELNWTIIHFNTSNIWLVNLSRVVAECRYVQNSLHICIKITFLLIHNHLFQNQTFFFIQHTITNVCFVEIYFTSLCQLYTDTDTDTDTVTDTDNLLFYCLLWCYTL